MKNYKRSIITATLLLMYASLIFFFLTIPAFETTFLKGKAEVSIVTLLPLMAAILGFVILSKKNGTEQVLKDFPKQNFTTQFFFIYGVFFFILAPLVIFTEKKETIEMCDTIWTPAWIISLGVAISVTTWLFIYGKSKADFTGQLIFLCVITFPLAYFFPIILFKLLAFGVGCLD